MANEKLMARFRTDCGRFFDALWPAEEKTLVYGEGPVERPALALIGEAPGEQETLLGRPFVGKAGKNLDGFLAAVGLHREDIYITNVVKVRPTKLSSKGTVSNRPPNREELALFTPWLYRELLLVKPQRVVTLGNVALQAMLGRGEVIGAHHGVQTLALVTQDDESAEFPLFPLYHPASIIYNRALQSVYEADLLALRALLDAVN